MRYTPQTTKQYGDINDPAAARNAKTRLLLKDDHTGRHIAIFVPTLDLQKPPPELTSYPLPIFGYQVDTSPHPIPTQPQVIKNSAEILLSTYIDHYASLNTPQIDDGKLKHIAQFVAARHALIDLQTVHIYANKPQVQRDYTSLALTFMHYRHTQISADTPPDVRVSTYALEPAHTDQLGTQYKASEQHKSWATAHKWVKAYSGAGFAHNLTRSVYEEINQDHILTKYDYAMRMVMENHNSILDKLWDAKRKYPLAFNPQRPIYAEHVLNLSRIPNGIDNAALQSIEAYL